ncbi:4Fe-4S cluster-binding domain-containing protein [Streptomyces sp. bgisy100]|uniref:4Fe-4S cluster-binding domain-containing protein n=1 Tax=Streptomyces sp. bgisy100 TaxID=3413783 RepID=UPI003D713CCA
MIKEGQYTYVEGSGRAVVPYTGKYAVKVPNCFEMIRAGWEAVALPVALPYNPLRVEFEITDGCNDTCSSCGMGAKPLSEGTTLTTAQLDSLVAEFEDVGLPSYAVTGGEPFTAMDALLHVIRRARGTVDLGKLTTNGIWGGEETTARRFDQLVSAGLLDNRIFVPVLMLSVGEQTTPLERVARIIYYTVTQFTDRELNIAVSSLDDPSLREHQQLFKLLDVYQKMYGQFPHDRVHSTMRVYLENDRLKSQAPIHRPGSTSVTRWMASCYDCFAPTVGTYVLPHALMKVSGDLYSCAAFNVPEKLRFGNLLEENFRTILDRVNATQYVRTIRDGGGLAGVDSIVPKETTDQMTCGSFCGSCALLIDKVEGLTGERIGLPNLPTIPVSSLFRQQEASQ